MANYNIQPWPSTYRQIGETEPKYLTSRFGRQVKAFRTAIPARTIEPPQIHLVAPRDGQVFEELIADFTLPFHVAVFNAKTGGLRRKEFNPGQEIVIPEYIAHWLINPNGTELEFTCEYAPHPRDGNGDEPEFETLDALLKFVDERDLREKLIEAKWE